MSAFSNHAESQVTAASPTTFSSPNGVAAQGSMAEVAPLESTKDVSAVSFAPGMKLREIERIVILETLKQRSFNRTHTARALGIGIRTLQRKLKRYGASDWGIKGVKADA